MQIKLALTLMAIMSFACGLLSPAPTPTATASPTAESNSGTMAQGFFGEIRMLTTDLYVARGEKPQLPMFLTSYQADRFEVYGYLCYHEDGITPIYAIIEPASGGIQPGQRLQFSLYGNDEPQTCVGRLIVKLYKGKEVEILTVPVSVTIAPAR